MLDKIKKYYEENKKTIFVVGGIVTLVAFTAIVTKNVIMIEQKGVSIITFRDKGKRIDLKEALSFIEKNHDVPASYAIVHNAGESDSFIGLLLN